MLVRTTVLNLRRDREAFFFTRQILYIDKWISKFFSQAHFAPAIRWRSLHQRTPILPSRSRRSKRTANLKSARQISIGPRCWAGVKADGARTTDGAQFWCKKRP